MVKRNRQINKYYWIFASLRFLLTLAPQTGYIHPDEFFQNVEILASRTFEYEASLPWEFNSTSPIRSIGVSYFTIGLSCQILKTISMLFQAYIPFAIVNPYTILVTPRVCICLLSYIIDYVIYSICVKNNEKSYARLYVLSTSYVMLVYCTRTFSNSLEVILLALLLYFVADSMTFSNILVKQREYLNNRYSRADNPADRAKFHKLRLFLASDSYRNCIQISTISVLGFFNRPTFLAYAIFPIFFWLYRGIGYKSVSTLQFNMRIFVLLLAAIPTILFMVLIDSFFYGYITWGEIGVLAVSIENFVFAPLNFIKYNIDAKNLAVHGLHPRYLHTFVNVPLLFNILGVFAILGAMDMTKKLLQRKFGQLPTVRSIKGLMTMAYIGPVFFLSIFPHQEPRFLIPIIIPLVYLFANKICDDKELGLIRAPPKPQFATANNDAAVRNNKKPKTNDMNALFKLWIGLNLAFTLFYGFVHQGGVTPAAFELARSMRTNYHYNYHVVTSHIYSIPHVLFMQPANDTLIKHGSSAFKLKKRLFTYEEGSKPLPLLKQQLLSILEEASNSKRRFKVYLLITGSLHYELLFDQPNMPEIQFEEVLSFYPHISVEALPKFGDIMLLNSMNASKVQIFDFFYEVYCSMNLKMYEVRLV